MSGRTKLVQKQREILCVEDSPTQAAQLQDLLEQHGYRVSLAADGRQALARLAAHKPALIISDINMPEMNGYELCRHLKADERTSNIPVILLTALTNPEDVLEGLACGADSFITKPYKNDYLLDHVEQLLVNWKLRQGERVRVGVEVTFAGKRRFISADQQQMLGLLLSTYEAAVQRNSELVETQEALRQLSDELEEKVEHRTAELSAEVEERKRAEEEIASVAKFPSEDPSPVLRLSRQGTILYANDAAAPLLADWDCVVGASAPEKWCGLAERTCSSGEFTYMDAPCGETVFSMQVAPVAAAGYVNIYGRDVTESKRLQNALIHSELNYRRLFEAAQDGVLILDAESGVIRDVNPYLVEMLGRSRTDIVGKHLWELHSFHDVARDRDSFLAFQAKDQVRDENLAFEKKDGGQILVEFVSSVYTVDGRRVIQCNVRDVTERRRTEEALAKERSLLRALTDNIPDTIYFKDLEGRFVQINNAQARRLGLNDPEQAVGKTDFDFFDQEHARLADEAERAVLATGQPLIAAETKLTWPDGQVGWVSTTKMPLPDENGNIIGTFGISRDITEHKRADDERKALFDIMRGLSTTVNLQEYLELIRQSLNTVLDAQNFFVVLRNNRSGLFEEVFAMDKYDAPMPPSGLEKSITSYVYRTGEPLLLTAAKFDDLLASGEVELIGAKPASWLGAPLRAAAHTIGVIAVQNHEDPGCYSERDREFLNSAGTQVAAAIARMQAEKAVKESELRYRNLVEMSPDAVAVHQNGKFVYANQAVRNSSALKTPGN